MKRKGVGPRRVQNRDVLETYFARRVPSGALSRRHSREFFFVPSSRSALLEDGIASRSLPTLLVFLAQNAEAPTDPVDAVRRVNIALKSEWRLHSTDVVEDARKLVLSIFDVTIPEESEDAFRDLVSSKDSLVLGESVLLRIMRDLGLWRNGKMTVESSPDNNRWTEKFSTSFVLEMKSIWFQTISSSDIADLIRLEPSFMSALYRWGQLDPFPFETVKERLNQFIQTPRDATDFANGYAPRNGIAMSIDGVEQLIADIPRFLSLLRQGSPYASVMSQFNEVYGDPASFLRSRPIPPPPASS